MARPKVILFKMLLLKLNHNYSEFRRTKERSILLKEHLRGKGKKGLISHAGRDPETFEKRIKICDDDEVVCKIDGRPV